MKRIEDQDLGKIPGRRLEDGDVFCFECRPDISCFNLCCRNLNLFLYPYDIVRLKKKLRMTASEVIEKHTDVVLRPGNFFPEVLLTMADNEEKTCPFLSEKGCTVYSDRMYACRTFPTEHGVSMDEATGVLTPVHFCKPPDFCQGQYETKEWTVSSWSQDQGAVYYHKMMTEWTKVKILFQNDPWGADGPEGKMARMAFMAAYNMDDFKDFVFKSTFLKRYKVPKAFLKKAKKDEVELLRLGFAWIKLFCFGYPSPELGLV